MMGLFWLGFMLGNDHQVLGAEVEQSEQVLANSVDNLMKNSISSLLETKASVRLESYLSLIHNTS